MTSTFNNEIQLNVKYFDISEQFSDVFVIINVSTLMWVESEENSYEGSTEEESQILDLGLKPGFGTLPLPNWIKRSSEPRVWSFEDVTSGEKLSRMEVDRNVYATYFRKVWTIDFLGLLRLKQINFQSEQSICDLEKPLKIQNVKIDPGRMVFKDAYDGKMFKRTLTITNYGKTIVNVRIFSPSSKVKVSIN